MYSKESEDTWGERQKQVALEPGQECCINCGRVIEPDERRNCAQCEHDGCTHCFHLIDTTGAEDLNDDWACSEECELDWLQGLKDASERMYKVYQAWIGTKIEAARKKVA